VALSVTRKLLLTPPHFSQGKVLCAARTFLPYFSKSDEAVNVFGAKIVNNSVDIYELTSCSFLIEVATFEWQKS
jgi:hypothetical protein